MFLLNVKVAVRVTGVSVSLGWIVPYAGFSAPLSTTVTAASELSQLIVDQPQLSSVRGGGRPDGEGEFLRVGDAVLRDRSGQDDGHVIARRERDGAGVGDDRRVAALPGDGRAVRAGRSQLELPGGGHSRRGDGQGRFIGRDVLGVLRDLRGAAALPFEHGEAAVDVLRVDVEGLVRRAEGDGKGVELHLGLELAVCLALVQRVADHLVGVDGAAGGIGICALQEVAIFNAADRVTIAVCNRDRDRAAGRVRRSTDGNDLAGVIAVLYDRRCSVVGNALTFFTASVL